MKDYLTFTIGTLIVLFLIKYSSDVKTTGYPHQDCGYYAFSKYTTEHPMATDAEISENMGAL